MARFNWHSCCSIKSVSWVGNARYRLVICSKSSTGMQEGKRMEDRSAMRHVCLFCWSYLVLSNRVRLVFVSRLHKYVLCTRRDILRKIL